MVLDEAVRFVPLFDKRYPAGLFICLARHWVSNEQRIMDGWGWGTEKS